MRTIKLTDIVIKQDRQRQEFPPEHITGLRESIEKTGLMHPPVLRQEGSQMVLVAGECRIKAITEIFELDGEFIHNLTIFREGTIPYTDIGELDELSAEEAELDENLKRQDLTWQEVAAAHDRLDSLRTRQKAKARDMYIDNVVTAGFVPDQEVLKTFVHTKADTAKEVFGRSDGSYQDTIRKEVIVAKHLASNPEVAKAKSVDEAFKILKKQEQRAANIELAKVVGATFNADRHMLLNRNCLDYMEEQAALIAYGHPEEAFDVILTDPPYGMDADSFGDGGGKLQGIEHHYDDSLESWRKLMTDWTRLSFQICKPQAHAYVFCDIDNFHELKALMQKAGWYVFRTPIICHKINSGRVPLPDQGPRRQYELVLYAIKGKKQVTHIYPDVLSATADDNMSHGAQKPVAVFQNLLQRSVKPGDRVFDGFAGSGTIFEAANGFQCSAVACEVNPDYYGMGLRRIQGLKALEQPSLI
jgi:DNA modification methylase